MNLCIIRILEELNCWIWQGIDFHQYMSNSYYLVATQTGLSLQRIPHSMQASSCCASKLCDWDLCLLPLPNANTRDPAC
jgi:hypothetical protein